MKKVIAVITLMLGLTSLYAQTSELSLSVSKETVDSPGPIIHYTDKLMTPELKQILSKIEKNSESKKLGKVTADNVGDLKMFWVNNSDNGTFESRQFKLMRKGTVSQLWFATEDIDNGRLNESVADTMTAYLETKTNSNSYNPQKGVIALGNQVFGAPPNFDGDGLSDVLVCDIRDGWTPGNGYIAGFFYSVDQYTQAALNNSGNGEYKSNERDVIYIDSYPGIYNNGNINPFGPLSTLSHEYQHLIMYKYDQSEITFINEAQSCFASLLVGYTPHSSVSGFLANTNVPIFIWRSGNDVLNDYGRAASFSSYIWDRFGFKNAGKLTQSNFTGNGGVDQVLSQMSTGQTFNTLLVNWAVANVLGDTTGNRLFGYNHPLIKNWRAAKLTHSSPTQSATENVFRGGSKYIAYQNVSDLQMTVTFAATGKVKAITKKGGVNTVYDIVSGVKWTSSAGVIFDEIIFVFVNSNASTTGASDPTALGFSYVSSAVQTTDTKKDYGPAKYYWEVPYYNGSNVGRFGFSQKYTVPVVGTLKTLRFYSVTGTGTGGVQIGVKGSGTIKLCVYSDNAGFPGALLKSKTINFSQVTADWNSIDVSEWDYVFQANTPFHIAYEFSAPVIDLTINAVPLRLDDGTGTQNVTKIYTGSAYVAPFVETNNNQNNVWNEIVYQIGVGVNEEENNNITGFNLSQNYPNPFNPNTIISYHLPAVSHVTLVVFDLLGREVATLVNELKPVGTYTADFNASHLPSGVYFYKITAGNYSETKKMMFIK